MSERNASNAKEKTSIKIQARTTPNVLLRKQRKARYWTQTELARLVGTTYLSISRWESGTTTPSLYYRKQLCEIFQLSAEELGLISPSDETTTQELSLNTSVIWNVPYRRNPFFTGRDYFLARLHALLTSSRAIALSQTQAISGLGGIGKTQTALEYAYRHRNDYQAVLWARAENRDVLYTDLIDIATRLHLLEQDTQDAASTIRAVKSWLGSHSNWLLILDNVEDLSLVNTIIPTDVQGHILLTTRTQSTGTTAQHLDLEQMNQEEGTFFLLRRAKLLGPDAPLESAPQNAVQHASKICTLLDGLPLALDQAGAYIEETGCSLTDYLEHYHARRASLLQRRGQRSLDHPESISTTITLCVEKVASTHSVAIAILRLCAFLSPDAIPEEIFTEDASELNPLLASVVTDPFVLNEAFATLRSYSLIRRNPESKILTIHRLVQATLKDSMNELEQQWATLCVHAVRRMFPDHDISFWQASSRLLPQAQACATLVTQWNMVSLEAVQLLDLTGYYLMQQGQYDEARLLLQQALLRTEQSVGSEHIQTATCLEHLGELYWHENNFEQSAVVRERALKILERTVGPDHPDIACELDNLALVYHSQGRPALAKPLFIRSYSMSERLMAGTNSDALRVTMASCAENLANLYIEAGQFAQAEPLMIQSLDLMKQMYGTHHPMIAFNYHNMAYLYEWQGRYAMAESLYRQALTVREEQLGGEHPNTAATLHNLARIYQRQANYVLAESYFQRALAAREKSLGPAHAKVAHTLSQIGSLYYDQTRYDQAEPMLLRALAIREHALGSEHPEVAWDLEALAQVYEAQERYSEAKPLVQRALTIYEQQLGVDHLDSLESLIVAGTLCYKQGQFADAEHFLNRALAICERLLGASHPKTATSLLTLAELYVLQGRNTEAVQFFQQALTIREQQLGTTHPDTVVTHERYTAFLQNGKNKNGNTL